MSLFFVDSSCDLDSQQIKSLGIECFNLPYVLDGELKTLDEDFEFSKFYSKVRKGEGVKYQSLSEKEYMKVFEPALKGGDDIIYVYSSGLIFDSTNVLSAREKLLKKYSERKFELIDSKNFSIGHGNVCFLLGLQYHNGSTIEEIIEYSYDLIDSVACYMVVDSIQPLIVSGIMDENSMVGSALNIKSILAVDIDGSIRLVEKVSGKKRALSKIVQLIRQTGKNIADNPLFIANSHAETDAQYIVDTLKGYLGDEMKVLESNITPSNVSIVGNGAVVVAFRVYKKIH
jgi:DegV family protein with EDD domain